MFTPDRLLLLLLVRLLFDRERDFEDLMSVVFQRWEQAIGPPF
jgi:hypothetical protein